MGFWPHPLSTFSQAAPTVSLATAGNLGDTGGDMLQSVGVARAWYESIAGAVCVCVSEIQPPPEPSFWRILWWQHWHSSSWTHAHAHTHRKERGKGGEIGGKMWNMKQEHLSSGAFLHKHSLIVKKKTWQLIREMFFIVYTLVPLRPQCVAISGAAGETGRLSLCDLSSPPLLLLSEAASFVRLRGFHNRLIN